MKTPYYLEANWPAPKNIRALTVTYPEDFSDIQADLNLPAKPIWLEQVHSNIAVTVESEQQRTADASITESTTHPLIIRTADCLPILICNQSGTEIAAIHGGWRGLLGGIIENTILKLKSQPNACMAWTGPAICQHCFEVGPEVPRAFIQKYPDTKAAFKAIPNSNKYWGDLKKIAEIILKAHGMKSIYHANACTFEEKNKFYSYRRDQQTGRIMTLIWFDHANLA